MVSPALEGFCRTSDTQSALDINRVTDTHANIWQSTAYQLDLRQNLRLLCLDRVRQHDQYAEGLAGNFTVQPQMAKLGVQH